MSEIVELRVHGVGGPQAPKMLGWPSGSDVETLPPMTISFPGASETVVSPPDGSTRFVRPLHQEPGRPVTEGYEWGGLTMGSLLKGLWVTFLPLTLLNVGGWARSECGTAAP